VPVIPPPNWQPLVDPVTSGRRRKRVLIWTSVAAVLAIGLSSAFVGLVLYTINKVPDGYTASDVCWSAEGKADQATGDQNLIEVPCSLDHDYVSGKTVNSEADCPGKNGYLDNGDGTFVCLDDPHKPTADVTDSQ
jgi:hypothetical protein